MRKALVVLSIIILLLISTAFAQTKIYTVQAGDTIWSIAVKNQIGISELLKENP